MPFMVAKHSMVGWQNSIIGIGGIQKTATDSFPDSTPLYQFKCENTKCSWKRMDHTLKEQRMSFMAFLIPNRRFSVKLT